MREGEVCPRHPFAVVACDTNALNIGREQEGGSKTAQCDQYCEPTKRAVVCLRNIITRNKILNTSSDNPEIFQIRVTGQCLKHFSR